MNLEWPLLGICTLGWLSIYIGENTISSRQGLAVASKGLKINKNKIL